mmetsp:Transcript_36297/g.44786  ORF Transcript_36297/g.44786 Transcript_36297/m.44786 type:complete len:203 (+) Transcript_36297:108-716(+)
MGKFVLKTGDDKSKRMMSIKAKLKAAGKIKKKKSEETKNIRVDAQGSIVKSRPEHFSELFFKHNKCLGPPYHIICDTNFFYYSRRAKKDIFMEMVRILMAKCYLYVTDCIIGEAQKMGRKYKSMLRSMKDPRIRRLKCQHKGIYADDCICKRVESHRIYLVATCDRDLKKRIRKIPGVPIVFVQAHRFNVERLPEAYGAPRM